MDNKKEFAKVLHEHLSNQLSEEKVLSMIEKPKYENMGDLAFPCFELAKVYRKAPKVIAEELATKLTFPTIIEKVEAVSGYLNVYFNQEEVSAVILGEILEKKESFGDLKIGNQEIITIDFSSPNIAKPFSMGHLRSTVIGNSLALIAEKSGYKAIRINHLGDWGTQFGKLIVAYKKWGDEKLVRENPIKELLKLYVHFHGEAEKDEQLNDEGRAWFKRLEDGDAEALELWKWFREESLKEFSKIYDLLGVSFDSTHGEAFYNDKMNAVVQQLEEKHLLKDSDGAKVVEMEDDMPPCLIKKRDGTTLYATRDLAAAIYRQDTYKFTKSLYVVGNEQTLHFKQFFTVLEKMDYEWHKGLEHVPFGMMLKDGKKMSTRKGKVVLLEDVLKDAIQQANNNITEKNPALAEKETVAHQVGTGAVIFHDLKNYRLNDVEFSLDEMLKFEGETGPYVQYTHARATSILKKGMYVETNDKGKIIDEAAWPIVKTLGDFPEAVERAHHLNDPSQIAKYTLELAKGFNKFYGSVRILADEEKKQTRLALVSAVQVVLKEGLRLLGITAPNEM